VPVKARSPLEPGNLSFITTEPPFITDNVPRCSRTSGHSRRSYVDSSHSGWSLLHGTRTMAGMLAQSVIALSLVVRIYDAYGVPAEHLTRARMTVDRIFKDASVTIAWPQCPCPAPVGADELVVRVIAAPPAREPASLGFSYVDVQHKAGTLATVFADRVHALSAAARIDDGELLGRAIAHEVSHLLFGTPDHEHVGLMRSVWTTTDLTNQRADAWTLSRDEAVRIRQAIARRLIEALQPAVVIADANAAWDVSAP
jgi:hypothetical protein